MKCGYCGNKDHTITDCPLDNDLVNLLYSKDELDFNSMSYKVLRKIASTIGYKTTFTKSKLIKIFTDIKKEYIKEEEPVECAICYETLEKTNICTTSCGHTFCMTCIIQLARSTSSNNNSCPLCRQVLVEQYTPVIQSDEFINIIQSTIHYENEEPISPIEPRELFIDYENVDEYTNNNNQNNDNQNNDNQNNNNQNNDNQNNNNYFEQNISDNIIYDNEMNIINMLANNLNINRRIGHNEEEYRERLHYIIERY